MVKHMKGNPPSPAMRRAIELARENGGRLVRGEAGDGGRLKDGLGPLWTNNYPCTNNWLTEDLFFSDRTVQALVDRGLAKYTSWARDPVRHPVEVTLCS